jgi:hypothetical protein
LPPIAGRIPSRFGICEKQCKRAVTACSARIQKNKTAASGERSECPNRDPRFSIKRKVNTPRRWSTDCRHRRKDGIPARARRPWTATRQVSRSRSMTALESCWWSASSKPKQSCHPRIHPGTPWQLIGDLRGRDQCSLVRLA